MAYEFMPGEEQKIADAFEALAKDPHAPREVSVKVRVHIHNEYPKHVVTGKDKNGNAITKIVNSEAEEAEASPKSSWSKGK